MVSEFVTGPPDKRVYQYLEECEPEVTEGTRIYSDIGERDSLMFWNEQLHSYFGMDLVPYDWAPDYVGVTRAAIRKREQKGQLTVFQLSMEEWVLGLFGERRRRMREKYRFVLRTELNIWILQSIDEQLLERGDIRLLRTEHIDGWWNEPDVLKDLGIT